MDRLIFVCIEFYTPLESFSLIWRRHLYQWRAANFDIYSALMTIEQWRFLSVLHLLWHGTSVYNDHLRELMTPVANQALSSGADTTCFNDCDLSRLGFEQPTFSMQLHHRRSDR